MASPESPAFKWQFADFEFDEVQWLLLRRGQPLELERRPLELLQCLLHRAGEVVTKEELLVGLHGHVHIVDRALTNAVVKLRKALCDQEQTLIQTVQRVGYRFAAPVRRTLIAMAPPAALPLQAGDSVPCREGWRLQRPLGTQPQSHVWLGADTLGSGQHVFKFSPDGQGLAGLKRELTLFRVLRQGLGPRDDFVEVLGTNFEVSPYFVECEYRGHNLLEWAETGALKAMPLPERIELAIRVVEAVAAAHSVGVLHKDLKPANILVDTTAAGTLRLCVSDFGSGKLLDPAWLRQLETGFTQTRSILDDAPSATLAYLPPEVLAGQASTIQTDVYALGILLYQLAIGDLRRPLAPGWEEQIDDALLRQDIAQAAHGEVARRLSSAQELAERLRQLPQRHEALLRERQTAAHNARLAAALERDRLRRPLLYAALAVFALGFAASLFFYLQSVRQRDQARAQSARAEAINKFLNDDVLLLASPAQGGDPTISLVDAVVRASGAIDRELAGSPLTAAELHITLGNDFFSFWQDKLAAQQFSQAAEIYTKALGRSADPTLQARFLQVKAIAHGQNEEEWQLYDRTVADLAANPRPSPKTQMTRYEAHATILRQLYRPQEAVNDLLMARQQAAKAADVDPRYVDRLDMSIGRILVRTGHTEQGLAMLENGTQKVADTLGPDHFQTLYSELVLVNAYIEVGKLEPARALVDKTYQPALDKYGPDSIIALWAQEGRATLLADTGKYAEAEALRRSLYQRRIKQEGPLSNAALYNLHDLAELLQQQGRYSESLSLLAQGLRGSVGADGKLAHPMVVIGLSDQVNALIGLNRAAEAQPLLAQIRLQDLQHADPTKHDWPAILATQQAALTLAQGHPAPAADQLRTTLPTLQAHEKPDAPILHLAQQQLAAAERLAQHSK